MMRPRDREPLLSLSDDLFADSVTVGTARYFYDREHDIQGEAHSDRHPMLLSIDGAAGEFCYYLRHELKIEGSRLYYVGPSSKRDGTDRGDVWHYGWNIEIRSTGYETGHVLVLPWSVTSRVVGPRVVIPDYYALMIGQYDRPYRFAGYISAVEMLRKERLMPWGKRRVMNYVASQYDLIAELPPGRSIMPVQFQPYSLPVVAA